MALPWGGASTLNSCWFLISSCSITNTFVLRLFQSFTALFNLSQRLAYSLVASLFWFGKASLMRDIFSHTWEELFCLFLIRRQVGHFHRAYYIPVITSSRFLLMFLCYWLCVIWNCASPFSAKLVLRASDITCPINCRAHILHCHDLTVGPVPPFYLTILTASHSVHTMHNFASVGVAHKRDMLVVPTHLFWAWSTNAEGVLPTAAPFPCPRQSFRKGSVTFLWLLLFWPTLTWSFALSAASITSPSVVAFSSCSFPLRLLLALLPQQFAARSKFTAAPLPLQCFMLSLSI